MFLMNDYGLNGLKSIKILAFSNILFKKVCYAFNNLRINFF